MANKESKWGYILLGLLFLAIGVCFIVFSNALTVLAISIGAIMTLFGIIFGTLTLAKKTRGAGFTFKTIFSIFSIVCGITTAIFNDGAIAVIVSIFSLLLIVDGSFKLNTSAMSKRYSVGGWWIMLVVSLLIIISAFILTKDTPDDPTHSTVWLGLTVALDGLANLFSAYWTSRYEKAEHKEIYEEIAAAEAKKNE
jgi:uncharacterized membrane protein HdeD (DUF308 family)